MASQAQRRDTPSAKNVPAHYYTLVYGACASTTVLEVESTAKSTPLNRLAVFRTLFFGRHYADLILRLQQEMRTELRRLAKESKTQEELVENLRDKIASQTVRVVRRVARTFCEGAVTP